jgi:O-methyltransferase involved in polyketide biosynthesis
MSVKTKKKTLSLQGVPQTLLIPLWGRAVYSQLYPEILTDKQAAQIINSVSFDFREVEKSFGEYGGLLYIIRGRKIDDVIRQFIAKHPRASVVNIGAGLDTTFSRVDNGQLHWYDLDLPEVITLRKSLIPERRRSKCLAKSVFDYSWMDDIHFRPQDGILFIAAGVFYYFKQEQVQDLLITLAKNFPGGELYFDGQTKTALKISNKMVQKSGNKQALMYFYISSPKIFNAWSPRLKLKSNHSFLTNIKLDRRWQKSTKIKMLVCHLLKMASFYQLQFREET